MEAIFIFEIVTFKVLDVNWMLTRLLLIYKILIRLLKILFYM